MADDKSLSVFKCPSCGAPLEPEAGASTMRCPYCGASIVIPESLRSPAARSMSLSDVTELAKQGRFDEAARIYSKITGLNHEYALISVKSMAGVHDDEPASNYPKTVDQPQMRPSYQTPQSAQPVYSPPRDKARGGSCISTIVRIVILISILSTAVPALLKALQFKLPSFPQADAIIPIPFAKEIKTFSPGMGKDPRAIGLDGNGNVWVLDYKNDEVLIFDAEGNSISSIKVSNNGNRAYASEMAVSSDGVVYIPVASKILVLNENGESLREIHVDFGIIHSITLGAEDVLHAMTSEGIIRFDENGEVDLKIATETLEEISGEYPGTGLIGVDGQGNIYFSGTFNRAILKFSPNGDYISTFGGNSTGDFKPGEFNSPRQIAFDGYGRIYVVDFFDVQVFDSDFNYINRIEGQFWGVDFDTQNNMYAITNLSNDVVKYEIQKPNP